MTDRGSTSTSSSSSTPAEQHSPVLSTGRVHLERGVHAISIKYFQGGGYFHFDLLWAREAAPLALMPAWVLSTRHATFPRFLASVIVRRALFATVVLWLGACLVVAVPPLRRSLKQRIGVLTSEPIYVALVCVIAASCVLNLAGIWWGLPTYWAGDEIAPPAVLVGLAHGFTGGWFDRYPPFQFYVLSRGVQPVAAVEIARVDSAFRSL